MNDITVQDKSIIEKIVLTGDISGLTQEQQVQYYGALCARLGLDPLTQPFNVLVLNGKKVMYATRAASEQLRKINGVSVVDMKNETLDGIFKVTVKVQDKDGRTDIASGTVSLLEEIKKWNDDKKKMQGTGQYRDLNPIERANAMLKAETKAKRRATLSICGLGMMDETEAETMKTPIENNNGKIEKNNTTNTPENAKIPPLEAKKTPSQEKVQTGVTEGYLQEAINYFTDCGVPTADIKATIRLVAKRNCLAKDLNLLELNEVLKRVQKQADNIKAKNNADQIMLDAGFDPTPVNFEEIPLPGMN